MRTTRTARFVGLIAGAALLIGCAPTASSTGSPATASPAPVATETAVPAETTAPPRTAAPTTGAAACVQLDPGATYTGHAGTLPVSVTVPAASTAPWAGDPDGFALTNGPCGSSATIRFDALLVGHVYADSCHWKASSVDAPTAFDAVSQLERQKGHGTSGPIGSRLGPYPATRFDVTAQNGFDVATCDDGVLRLGGGGPDGDEVLIVPGWTMQVYVTEVDGVTLVVTVGYRPEDATPAVLAEIDAVVASLRVDM